MRVKLLRPNPFRIVVFLLLNSVISVSSAIGYSQTLRTIDKTKCVSQAYDKIGGDVALGQLILDDRKKAKTFTDNRRLFERYRNRISLIFDEAKPLNKRRDMYFTSSVIFRFNQRERKQMGSGIICTHKFIHPSRNCRNRTYFFFTAHEPEEVAKIITNDIVKEKPIVRKCHFTWASSSPRPSDNW